MVTLNGNIFLYSWYCHVIDKDTLNNELESLLVRSGFTILKTVEHEFSPQGYTGIFLLSESHLAVHTFPENGISWIELASCSEEKYLQFRNLIALSFLYGKECVNIELQPHDKKGN